jgi:hypothetical protein
MGCNPLSDLLSPAERLYLEIRRPSPPKPAPKVPDPAPPIHLDGADVDAILKRKRAASVEELEWAIAHANELHLRPWQRDQIGVELTLVLANRARPKPTTPEFFYHTLGITQTPVGLLHDRGWVDQELKAGAQAIFDCRRHSPPRCKCWRATRERLWDIQDNFGAASPEAWATVQLWTIFEELEFAERPQRIPAFNLSPQPAP